MTTCGSCGADNDGDARFCSTCGAPLGSSCPSCGRAIPEGARFCPSCGTPLEVAVPAGEERKLITILFADVTGSTALGERLDPERFREVMTAFAQAMREEIEAEGGTVEKYIGDAVMAAFGVPTAHEDDPARACRAALRMRDRLELLNERLDASHDVQLEMRVGVNTGEVLAAVAPRSGEGMAHGDAVNAAARLQTSAEPGRILVGARTADAARGFRFGPSAELRVKGKSEAIVAVELLDAIEGAVSERGVPGLHAPMIGRDRELDLMRSLYRRVVDDRRPHLVTVYGDAGVGKSRLTREFLTGAEAEAPHPLVLRGRCLPYGTGITYWPLAEILKGHAGILDTDAPELAVEKVRKTGRELLTSDVTADPARATAALAYTVGLEDPDVSFADADPREVRDELHAAWRSFFSGLASATPVITLVEDIHWADPVLLDLLEEIADRAEGPVLFVCPSRPDLTARRPDWGGGRRNASSVALDPLSPDDARRLVRSLLTVDDLPPSVHERILERAEGNPFYLEEIIRRLIDDGSLARSGDRWRAVADTGAIEIPDTVQAVLASRIDLLDASDKRALQAAAVVGRVFWPGPVAELTGSPTADLKEAFRRLESREMVLSRSGSTLAGQPEYLFKHILTRDVAYESLPRRERASAHGTVAAWLERTAGDRAGEFAELLAYHYATAVGLAGDAAADLRSTAHRWLLRASTDARRRLVLRRAQELAENALELATNDLERVDALEGLAEASMTSYVGDLAWRYFREAAFLRAEVEPPDDVRVAYLAARAVEVAIRWPGSIRGRVPDEAEVESLMELGVAHLPPGDTEERIRLLGLRAGWPFAFPAASYTPDQIEAAERAGVEASEVAVRLGLPNLASAALDNAQGAWISQGIYRRATTLWEQRAQVMSEVTDLLEIGDFWAVGAWSHYELARYRRALEITDQGIAAVGGRAPNVEIHIRAWRTVSLYRLGSWDEALRQFELVRNLLDERRDAPPYFASFAYGAAGMIAQIRGDQLESDRLAAVLMGISPTLSGRLYPSLLALLVVRGELEAASALARPTPWRVHAADAYESEAELLAAAGRWDAVPEFLREMRTHAEIAPAPSVLAFADRLEGRAGLAAADPERGIPRLAAASAGFAALEAGWEQAVTDLEVAEALTAAGRRDEARAPLASSTAIFEGLGAVAHVQRARSLASG
jgi:class 3 adenylate cyclase